MAALKNNGNSQWKRMAKIPFEGFLWLWLSMNCPSSITTEKTWQRINGSINMAEALHVLSRVLSLYYPNNFPIWTTSVTTLDQCRCNVCIYIHRHMHNINSKECIPKKPEVLFLTALYREFSFLVRLAGVRRRPRLSHALSHVIAFKGTEMPTPLHLPKSHLPQKIFGNNPPSPPWPLPPLTCC